MDKLGKGYNRNSYDYHWFEKRVGYWFKDLNSKSQTVYKMKNFIKHDGKEYVIDENDQSFCFDSCLFLGKDIPAGYVIEAKSLKNEAYNVPFEEPKKYDNGKPRMDLIRPEFSLALGECLGYGANKYDEPRGDTPNYLKGDGFNYSTIIASLERHIAAFKMGQDLDEESGLNHLAHAAVNLMFLHTYSLCEKGIDDRVVIGGGNESKNKKNT